MWIIERVEDDHRGHNQARCHACKYKFNIDLFTQKDVAMIMEAHECSNARDSFYDLF